MNTQYDLIVVGGGILGTFHAFHALKAGLTVLLLEKDQQAKSATVQNFGQVVPSGMNLKWQKFGRESLSLYKQIQDAFDISVRQNGTVYLASNEEEVQLIEELKQINASNDYTSRLMTKKECLNTFPGLREDYVKAGLFFPDEVTVEPRTMIHRLQEYMIKQMGLVMLSNTTVIDCEATTTGVIAHSSRSEVFSAKKLIICNGKDFKMLYPSLFEESDLELTKLQMLQTKKQHGYHLPGSILTGWTIRRYESFTECPSYQEIKALEDPNSFQRKWGVHILFKQAADGSVIIGDSHEYADAKSADMLDNQLNMDIDHFMIEEAKKIFSLPTFDIQQRWFGMYSQCKENDIFQKTIDENIHIVTGIGGKGMTGSAGFAKYHIQEIFNTAL